MSAEKLESILLEKLDALQEKGALKGEEMVITRVKPPEEKKGPRYIIEGLGAQEFLRMNSNSYLGMSLRNEIIEAEEKAAKKIWCGSRGSPIYQRHLSATHRIRKKTGKVP